MGFDQTPQEPTVSYTPTTKVAAAGIGGAISVVLIYALKAVWGVELPAEVAAAVATIVSFLSGYIKSS